MGRGMRIFEPRGKGGMCRVQVRQRVEVSHAGTEGKARSFNGLWRWIYCLFGLAAWDRLKSQASGRIGGAAVFGLVAIRGPGGGAGKGRIELKATALTHGRSDLVFFVFGKVWALSGFGGLKPALRMGFLEPGAGPLTPGQRDSGNPSQQRMGLEVRIFG